jgi:hypothetical protein
MRDDGGHRRVDGQPRLLAAAPVSTVHSALQLGTSKKLRAVQTLGILSREELQSTAQRCCIPCSQSARYAGDWCSGHQRRALCRKFAYGHSVDRSMSCIHTALYHLPNSANISYTTRRHAPAPRSRRDRQVACRQQVLAAARVMRHAK